MRKTLYGGLAAALLFGGAAFAADAPTEQQTQQTQDQTGQIQGQAGNTTQSQTKTGGPDQVITNPAGPDRSSPMTQTGSDEAPNSMAGESGQNTLQGQVKKVHKDRLTVKDQTGQSRQIYLGQSASIVRDGEQKSIKDLKKGDSVRVSYDVRKGKDYATSIQAFSSGAGQAQPSGQGQNQGTEDQNGSSNPGGAGGGY